MTSDTLLKTYRWSSNDPKDKFSVENPATGEIIAWVRCLCRIRRQPLRSYVAASLILDFAVL